MLDVAGFIGFALVGLLKLYLSKVPLKPRFVRLEYPMVTTSPPAAPPAIKMPIQLAGLKSRLQRAKLLEGKAGELGTRFDAALDGIDTAIAAGAQHAGQLEQYGNDLLSTINGMIDSGSNGAPADEEAPPVPISPPAPPAPPPGPNGGPRIL